MNELEDKLQMATMAALKWDMGGKLGLPTQLDRIEAKLNEIIRRLDKQEES